MSRKDRAESPHYVKDPQTGAITVSPRERLLERLPPSVGRSKAFADVHEKLAISKEIFDHHGDGGRSGVFRAIIDVVDYFSNLGIPRATLAPLSAVAAAIVDADHGTASAIFRPSRGAKGGKPPAPIDHLEFEGILATITECCVRHCKAEGQRPAVGPGCVLAAKLVNESNWPITVTATRMRELRERVQQSARSAPERNFFEETTSSAVANARPLDWAKQLLVHPWVGPPPKEISA